MEETSRTTTGGRVSFALIGGRGKRRLEIEWNGGGLEGEVGLRRVGMVAGRSELMRDSEGLRSKAV